MGGLRRGPGGVLQGKCYIVLQGTQSLPMMHALDAALSSTNGFNAQLQFQC